MILTAIKNSFFGHIRDFTPRSNKPFFLYFFIFWNSHKYFFRRGTGSILTSRHKTPLSGRHFTVIYNGYSIQFDVKRLTFEATIKPKCKGETSADVTSHTLASCRGTFLVSLRNGLLKMLISRLFFF